MHSCLGAVHVCVCCCSDCMYEQQVPENKRRESTLKGIVIARRNAGIATTFRLRRLVAGVGVESVFPL
jgi:ribosomal protein L19